MDVNKVTGSARKRSKEQIAPTEDSSTKPAVVTSIVINMRLGKSSLVEAKVYLVLTINPDVLCLFHISFMSLNIQYIHILKRKLNVMYAHSVAHMLYVYNEGFLHLESISNN